MKVETVVIVNDFNYIQGGASKVAIDTARLLKENNIKVIFFSAVNNNNDVIDGIEYISTNQNEALNEKNRIKGCINGIYNFKVKRKFKELLKILNKDTTVIHIHGWTKALSSSVFDIAFKMGFKVVLTLHDYFTACPNGGYFNYKSTEICHLKPLSWKCIKCNCDSRNYAFKIYRIIRQFVQNKIVKLNDRLENVITISEFSEKILRKTLNNSVKLYRVYNPIDIDQNHKIVDYNENENFLYVGRVSKEKGVDIFCEAITETNQKGIVVGDGPELISLKEKYKNIEFVGWKNSNEVKKYMRKARALIVPSKCFECAPLTPLEAMQYGVPIITSDCNATVDYISKNNKQCIYKNIYDLENILRSFSSKEFKFLYDENIFAERENYINKLLNIYEFL